MMIITPWRAALVVLASVCAAATLGMATFGLHPPRQGRVVPNVEFGALVNGSSANAVVRMACFGAVHPGQTGHPMSSQKLEVFRPEALQVPGFTGSAAHEIVAHFAEDPSVLIVLHRFAHSVPIPTTLVLPCGGPGSVVFSPQPSSATARQAVVTVGYVGQP